MHKLSHILLLPALIAALSCCSNSTGTGEEGGPWRLTVHTDPAEGGTAEPASGSFDHGASVSVEATAQPGWAFDGWTGDRESNSNPLVFTITGDTELTARFRENPTRYEVKLTLSDSTDTMDLWLGQLSGATEGFDGEYDFEAPPDPPPGALNGYFMTEGGLRLLKDFRSPDEESVTWTLQYTVGTGDSLTLAWSFEQNVLNGTLTLRTVDSSVEVDMAADRQATVPVEDRLLIEYRFGIQR